jgi:hypothetical protein
MFWAGLVLMIASFALYPAYLFVALLPISASSKVAGAVVLWLLSWAGFSAGSAMAGPEGIHYLRRLWRRRGGSG